mgnify:CR=1 FL=1
MLLDQNLCVLKPNVDFLGDVLVLCIRRGHCDDDDHEIGNKSLLHSIFVYQSFLNLAIVVQCHHLTRLRNDIYRPVLRNCVTQFVSFKSRSAANFFHF